MVENPYGQVNAVLGRILGLKQSVASLEAMTRTLAGAVAGHEATRPPAAPAMDQQIVVLSADGKGVPLRKPADAPAIAAHDHARGPKPDRKKMAVLGTAYQINPHARTPVAVVEALFRDPAVKPEWPNPRRPVPQHKRVCAVLPVVAAVTEALAPPRPAEVVFPWLAEEARRRDPDHQHPWVLLMDGQASLWDAAAETLGTAPRVEILDLLHATGYLWEAVHLFHDPGSAMALKWMKLLVLGLLSGMGTGVIRWLQHLAEQGHLPAAARTRLEQIHGYFDRHRDRIHYDRYLAAGYPIASGVIKGACRHVVKDRMERAGMHWTLPGAQALLNLRCVALNDEWEPFMNHYIQTETARLHANIPSQPPSTRLRLVHGRTTAEHAPHGLAGEIGAKHLGDEWERARCAQVALDNLDLVVLGHELYVERTRDLQRSRQLIRDVAGPPDGRQVQALRRQDQGRVTAVDPGVLHVLRDGPQHHPAGLSDRVDLDLPRVRFEFRHHHPSFTVIGKGTSLEITRSVIRKEFLPAAGPDVVVTRARR